MINDGKLIEMFKIFKAVKETGAYNMFAPQALDLANEMYENDEEEITKGNWGYMMKHYSYLESKSWVQGQPH